MSEEERLLALTIAAWDAKDGPLMDFYIKIKNDLTNLRKVGTYAARIWQDHSDEDAWDHLYDTLSTAGLLPEEPNGANESSHRG